MTHDLPYLDEIHRLLRETLRRFVEKEVVPAADAWERDGCVPREVLRAMGRHGFLGLRAPEAFGGGGLDALASALLAEELGRSTYGGFAITVLVHTDMAAPHLLNAGSREQLERWLPAVVAGECITAVAVTEPDAGSDVRGIRSRARRDGDDWLLNGSKLYITNGVHADLYFVAAKTDPAAGAKGISIFAVEKGAPGFHVSRSLDKLGWRSSDTAELAFDECRVPAANLLGEEGRGFYAIMRNFQNERIVLGAMAMGEAARALELTLEYVRSRQAFGAPLWDKQAVRQRLSMLAARVAAGRQLVYYAAWLDAQGRDCVKEVSMVKAEAAALLQQVVWTCQQMHGGAGYMRGMEIERLYRDARVQAIGGGATEVMLEEVAKRM